jgi:transcriptional regulator with XRE-family HTH domain
VIASTASPSVGSLLRSWRQRRQLTQLALANLAGVTARHLSFVETGRALPSRDMVLHLAHVLEVPELERNNLLVAAGFAPVFPKSAPADPYPGDVRRAIDTVLASYEPSPAAVIDRLRNVVAGNLACLLFIEDLPDDVLGDPFNSFLVGFHPAMASRIQNLDEWSEYVLGRLRRQALITGDAQLAALYEATVDLLPDGHGLASPSLNEVADRIGVPMLLQSRKGLLNLITTITSFGSALDIMLDDLVLVTFLPGDASTAELLREYARDLAEATN